MEFVLIKVIKLGFRSPDTGAAYFVRNPSSLTGHDAFSFNWIDVSGGTYLLEIQISGESRFEKVVVQKVSY